MHEMNERPKLVVLTGSFNPPSLAHLDLLKKAMAAVGAERGLFLPANGEYVRRKMAKANESVVISAEARIAMLESMCSDQPSLGLSLAEMGAARTSTYESLLRVSEENPGYDVLLVIGADKIKVVPKWIKVNELLRDFKFVISRRGDDEIDDFTDIEFNPNRQINCQAAAAALYISLCRTGKLEEVMSDRNLFVKLCRR